MKFTVLTLFPEVFEGYFTSSIMKRAVDEGKVELELINIRDFAFDKHRTCDDTPYGGGAGMLLKVEPLFRALDSVKAYKKHTVYLSPSGHSYSQRMAKRLSTESEIVLLCGRYEGVDQRVIDTYVDQEISIGDYVLSSGEVAALVIMDSVYRLLDGVITKESLIQESFSEGLLEYPQYTKPREYEGKAVPDVLVSGNHEAIRKWRLRRSLEKTLSNRADIVAALDKMDALSDEERGMLDEILFQQRLKGSKRKRRRGGSKINGENA